MAPRDNDLTATEAAVLLGVSERTIRRWIEAGYLDSYRIKRRLFITRGSVKSLQQQTSSDPKSKITRRGVFTVLGKMLMAGGWVFFLYDRLKDFMSWRSSIVGIEDLFPMWPNVQVVPGSHHPVDGYHPDIQIALERLTPLVPRSDPIIIKGANELPLPDLSRDLVLIGGPVSNVISLMNVHGYSYSGNKISVRPVRRTGFRWCFHYPFPSDDDLPSFRYVAGKLRSTMPKALVDTRASGSLAEPRFCKLDQKTGRIQSDYLLLTVMPNRIRHDFTGSTIIDVADLQGQGDKVFADVLRDSASRSELAKAVRRKRYFQALYEVPVSHDDSQCTTTPGTPRLLDVHLLV